MARPISCRYELSARLRVVTALAVGSGAEERGVDLAVARDGRGRPYVPGTSLAGALRAWSLLKGDQDRERRLWGWQSPDDAAQGWASRIWVEDAALELPQEAMMEEIRDGIAIDRRTGAAARGFKYERAVVPAGTTLALRLGCAVEPAHEAEALALLQEIRAGLRTGRLWLGAARSRGLGRLELVEGSDRLLRERLGTREEMLAALRRRVRRKPSEGERGQGEEVPETTEVRLAEPAELRLRLHWRPLGPLMVRASADGLSVDSLPLTAAVDGTRALLLPGSSIKGALRARAERILRTLLEARPAPADLPGQLLPHRLIGWMFGSAPTDQPAGHEAGATPQPGLAAVWVADCLSRSRVEADLWAQVESARRLGQADLGTAGEGDRQAQPGAEPSLREVLDRSPLLRAWDPAIHVAIDRWTGGAAEERLFSLLEPHGVGWGPIEIVVHLERLPAELHRPALALLLLVLDDLARGELPLGFATNRGLGDLEVETMEIEVQGATSLGWLAGRHSIGGRGLLAALGSARPAELAALRDTWGSWLAAHGRPASPPPGAPTDGRKAP
ncbi:MAG TPA: RAMP superfamily CRISPR-associated protein [Candidatus Dormibacteraeota bacterium]|nr:RAMP superfamily CRISPR-associated protein [Candidatus Dormibacteraeota bacterium]